MIGSITRTYKRVGLKGCIELTINIVSWYIFKYILKKRYIDKHILDFKLTLDLHDFGISKELYIWQEREQQLKFILNELIKKGMTVLDIGGNIGYYPIMEAKLIGQSGKVYVLEPYSPNYNLLLRNITLNDLKENIFAFPLAASDKEGVEHFHISEASNLGTMHPTDKDGSIVEYLTGDVLKVPAIDLSQFIQRNKLNNIVNIVRMDTEGAEVSILRGLIRAIEEKLFSGTIIFEVHSSKYHDKNDIIPILKTFFQMGYYPSIITSDDEDTTTLRKEGHTPINKIQVSNKKWRGIYTTVSKNDVIKHLTEIEDIRDVVLTFASRKAIRSCFASSMPRLRASDTPFKKIVYLTWQMLLKNIWRLSGGRREKSMGLALNLHPETVWPGRWGLRLPSEDCRSKIVAFTDLVQAHAVCNAVTAINHPVIIDAGAHHGEYAVLLGGLLKARGGGLVIAIEPDSANVSILRSNIARNDLQDVVHVVESAVSDLTGEMDFVSNGSEGHLILGENASEGVSYKIKVETLSDILARFQLDKVDLLFVDVEGAELPVLRGFPWVTIQPGMIFCELHPYNWKEFGYSGDDFTEFLQIHGYRCIDMYFEEHNNFGALDYIGPCIFLPTNRSL